MFYEKKITFLKIQEIFIKHFHFHSWERYKYMNIEFGMEV